MPRCRLPRPAVWLVLSIVSSPAAAEGGGLLGSAVFVQAASGEATQALRAGVQWDWGWGWSPRWCQDWRLSGYFELDVGRWHAGRDGRSSHAWISQVSVVPVLRLSGDGWQGWYGEAGIGPSVLSPLYESGDRRFSTRFQFRDHLAVGRRFGEGLHHEVALRLEHFSNAGITRPNPGLNLFGLRYAYRW